MREDWKIKNLEDACNIDYGTRVVKKKDAGTKYPVYGGGGATFNVDDFNRENSLVISRFAMSEQCTRFVQGKFFLNDSGLTVSSKNGDLLQDFLNLQMLSLNQTIYDLGRGTAQRNLDVPKFRQLKIQYPKSIEEQKRIVSILDKAFAAIDKAKANAEQNFNNAKELFDSYLEGIFANGHDWEKVKLENVCEITSKLIDPKEVQYQDLIHIGAGNIESKSGLLFNLKTAKEEGLISGKFLFDEQMVLYSKIRPYLMKVVSCNFVGLCSADIYPLVPIKGKMLKDFLYFLLLSDRFTKYAIAGSQRAGMPKVNRPHLFNYKFGCPSIKEQEDIVRKFKYLSQEAQKLQNIYEKKTNDLEELKKSILHKAFNSEL